MPLATPGMFVLIGGGVVALVAAVLVVRNRRRTIALPASLKSDADDFADDDDPVADPSAPRKIDPSVMSLLESDDDIDFGDGNLSPDPWAG